MLETDPGGVDLTGLELPQTDSVAAWLPGRTVRQRGHRDSLTEVPAFSLTGLPKSGCDKLERRKSDVSCAQLFESRPSRIPPLEQLLQLLHSDLRSADLVRFAFPTAKSGSPGTVGRFSVVCGATLAMFSSDFFGSLLRYRPRRASPHLTVF